MPSDDCRLSCAFRVAVLLLSVGYRQRCAQEPGVVTGHVVDARTGAGLEKVLVLVEDGGPSTQTDSAGAFRIAHRRAGSARLYVSVVGYILVRRDVQVPAGGRRRPHHSAERGHRHLHRNRDRGGGPVPRGRARRGGPAGARQRRHPESARRAGRRSAARRPGAAGRRGWRRSAQRVQRPRQRFHAHEHDGRWFLHALSCCTPSAPSRIGRPPGRSR